MNKKMYREHEGEKLHVGFNKVTHFQNYQQEKNKWGQVLAVLKSLSQLHYVHHFIKV